MLTRAVLMRLPADQIIVGRSYEYAPNSGGPNQHGMLQSVSHGWYTFDTGKAHGAGNVIREISAEMDVDTGPAEAMELEKAEHIERPPTVVDLILQIARGLGLYDRPTLLSVLIERTLQELRFLQGAKVLQGLVTNPKEVASCMQTADALLDLFRAGQASQTMIAQKTPSGVRNTVDALVKSIRATGAGDGAIHHIIYGIHGFTVVARDGRAELLQSFASRDDPETLGYNFANQRSGSVAEVAGWIADMAASTKQRRAQGQTAISGDPELMPATVLEDEEQKYPRLRFEWKWARLPSLAEIDDRLRKRIGTNLQFVKTNIKL